MLRDGRRGWRRASSPRRWRPPAWPARHAIGPRPGYRSAARAWGSARGALQQLAADREAELGDLAGRLRGGRRRARLPLGRDVAGSSKSSRRPPMPGAASRTGRGRGRGRSRAAAVGRRGRLERARGGGLRLRLRGGLAAAPSRRSWASRLVFAFALAFAFAPASASRRACGVALGRRRLPRGRLGGGRRLERARRGLARGFGLAAAAVFAAPAFAVAVGFAAARARPVLPRRLPIRSGRALESDPSTPGSSFFAFAFCFLGLSAMSVPSVGCRVRTRRTPAEHLRHPDDSAAPSCPQSRSLSRVRTIDDHFSSS